MDTVSIKNEFIKVEINKVGAQIKSVKSAKGTEFIWEADPNVWGHSAPILFPICGALKEDIYTVYGKTYEMGGHGFARRTLFEIRNISEEKVVLFIKESESTLAVYPFEFEFEVVFELEENVLKISYNVTNNSDRTLYYSVGCHEAYACPEGIEQYEVEFEKECDLVNYHADSALMTGEKTLFMKNAKVIDLKEEYFREDSLVFKNLGVYRASLNHKNSAKKITVDFPGYEYFLLWQKEGAKYICLEPWKGFPDHIDTDGDITKKEGIMAVEPSKKSVSVHSIKFED